MLIIISLCKMYQYAQKMHSEIQQKYSISPGIQHHPFIQGHLYTLLDVNCNTAVILRLKNEELLLH